MFDFGRSLWSPVEDPTSLTRFHWSTALDVSQNEAKEEEERKKN